MFVTTATELSRIMQCNGSRNMPASFPTFDNDTSERDLGTAAHWVAEQLFNGRANVEDIGDRKAPNGVYVTAEMVDYVQQYLAALDCGEMEVETSFGTDAWRVNARADHIKYDEASRIVTIDDFKYGHRIIEPENNWTLIAHAIGFCIFHNIMDGEICLRVHQPRPYHPLGPLREWRITFSDTMRYYNQIATVMSNPSDTLVTGPQCAKCRALATCPAARKAEMNAIDAIENSVFSDEIPNDVLARQLDELSAASAMIEQRLAALGELGMHRARGGAIVPNYVIDERFGHRAWKKGIDAETLRVMTGKDLSKGGTVTPAEAVRRGVPDFVIDTFTERPHIGIKLVRRDATKHAAKLLGVK